jgi:hypothetical protein
MTVPEKKMVASFIDGRIRIRDEAFISRSRAFDVEDALLKNKGITRASVNRRVGSLLVIYDAATMNGETIVGLISGYLYAGGSAAGTEGRRAKPACPRRAAAVCSADAVAVCEACLFRKVCRVGRERFRSRG